jgi:UDP-N-acetylglucosamine 2-epimerase (non-hydrolysing)
VQRQVDIVVGTRPEAIKTAPLILALQAVSGIDVRVIATRQHDKPAASILAEFGIRANVVLAGPGGARTPSKMLAVLLDQLDEALSSSRPALVLVQGDTTSAVAGAVAGFYARCSVVHLEAGLRSGDPTRPFPEEGNRRAITHLADLHLAPTPTAAENLAREGIDADAVLCTGNTVIDALQWATQQTPPSDEVFPTIGHPYGARIILITLHRREIWGASLRELTRAIVLAVSARNDVVAIWPTHPNPAVQATVESETKGRPNFVLMPPTGYRSFAALLARADLVVTDSGGIQEECVALGVPVLVVRDVTERGEAADGMRLRVVGTDSEHLRTALTGALQNLETLRCNPVDVFGDGRAAGRAARAVSWWLGLGPKPEPFVPSDRADPLGASHRRRD